MLKSIGFGKHTNMNKDFVKNSNEIEYELLEQHLKEWSLPKVKPTEIYSIGTFDFQSKLIIKTVERTLPISDMYETISLLTDDIKRYKKEYNFIHLGCVQIGFKPLTREGLNTSMCIALCDARHNKFTDSLLGLVETSLCRGPVYFNCYPDYEVSL